MFLDVELCWLLNLAYGHGFNLDQIWEMYDWELYPHQFLYKFELSKLVSHKVLSKNLMIIADNLIIKIIESVSCIFELILAGKS